MMVDVDIMVDVDEGRNDDVLSLLLFVGNTSLLLNRIDVAKENVKKLLWNRIGMIIVLSLIGKIRGYTSVEGCAVVAPVLSWLRLVEACCLVAFAEGELNFQKISGLNGHAPF